MTATSPTRAPGTRRAESAPACSSANHGCEHVRSKLEDTWSPQQIASWLRTEHPERREWHICHETIYQALYLGRKGGLRRALTAKLRTGRPLRKR
jgi:IS30 family transposase